MTRDDLEVRYNAILAAEFEHRLDTAPILYVPLGSLEWHSYHMPFGVDSDKAEAILIRVARKYGGIVAPAIPFGAMHGSWRTGTHPGLSDELRDAFYLEVLQGFAEVGFRVFACISGHWTSRQTRSMNRAIEHVCAGRGRAGFCLFDGSDPYDGFPADDDLAMDHAGELETSIYMHLFPERVRLDRLKAVDRTDLPGEECHLTTSGIQGNDPYVSADPEQGRRHVEKITDLIGRRAIALLEQVRAEEGIP